MGSVNTNLAEAFKESGFFSPANIFQPKVSIAAENSRYLLKTVDSREEFLQATGLRYEVFHGEMRGELTSGGIDTDSFDLDADILIIKDKSNNKVVGTYRMRCSLFTKLFYSEEEFNIEKLLQSPGTKIELSRACVHADYRTGPVIQLLWRGIYQYMEAVNAEYLFGCSSVTGAELYHIAQFQRHLLKQDKVLSEFEIYPKPDFFLDETTLHEIQKNSEHVVEHANDRSLMSIIPTLLQMYLKAGAQAALIPAWDQYFRCFDFFTVLKLEQLNPAFIRAFGLR